MTDIHRNGGVMKINPRLGSIVRMGMDLVGGDEGLDDHLPTEAVHKGWRLIWREPPPYAADPVILQDRDRRVLHQWDYTPTLGEVEEVCRRLLDG